MNQNQSVLNTLIKNKHSKLHWLSAAAFLISAAHLQALEYDLSASGPDSHEVNGAFGGQAIIADHFTQPTGTGVFQPFLTIDANGQTSTGDKRVEQGYNTDGFANLYLDQHRPQWNNLLKLGDLAQIDVRGNSYYAFLLDANEPGQDKGLISVDNIRIYTSASDGTALVADDLSKLDNLGTLRWAMNNPTQDANGNFNNNTWVKLNALQENVEAGDNVSNGGSGKSDLVAYIPVSAFVGAETTDYVWFYNLNGVHYSAEKGLAAESGFEEWRAVMGPSIQVPDGGTTTVLLGLSFLGLFAVSKNRE